MANGECRMSNVTGVKRGTGGVGGGGQGAGDRGQRDEKYVVDCYSSWLKKRSDDQGMTHTAANFLRSYTKRGDSHETIAVTAAAAAAE